MSEPESLSERELADQLTEELFSGRPRSVGEALAAADAEEQPAEEEPSEPEAEEAPVVVEDEPTEPAPELGEAPEEPTEVGEPEGEVEEEAEESADPNVVWATKKYGDDPAMWAKAAHDQEQHISRLASERREAEELASQWYEYAQQVESQAQTQTGMPMSAAEENWIEQSLANPLEYARQAAMQGNVNLYNGVIQRIAEENPMLAGQVGAQVQLEMQQLAASEDNGQQEPSLQESMGQSISRLGIDLSTYGEAMSGKVAELGEYHPYVQAILEGDQGNRDLALLAVYDLVRSSTVTMKKVRSDEREDNIKREGELRRQAAGVVTGGPTPPPVPKQSPFMEAMQEEWRARGQYAEE